MRSKLMTLVFSFLTLVTIAQEKKSEEKSKWKENFFTGGTISLGFYTNNFLVGGSPMFGYSPTEFIDAGVVVNYNYSSYRDYNNVIRNRLHQTIFGGGGFVKIYPVRFLFLQAQLEQNSIKQKLIDPSGFISSDKVSAGSTLIGGGYTTGRWGRAGTSFYYLSVLFDVSRNLYSPYTDEYGRSIPIFRAGMQIPLFQGKSAR